MAYLSDDELLDTEGGFTAWDDKIGAGSAEETLEQALAEERLAELDSELEQDEHPVDYDVELETEEEEAAPVSEKRLKREIRAEAVRRLEEAARSEKDFRVVVEEWNKLDRNRERRERDHENLRGDVPLEYQAVPEPKLIPRWMNNSAYRQLMAGNFLDILFDCPYEMHNLTADAFISRMVEELSEEHKEVLYFLSLRLYSTTRLAAVRGQSDRNIRKLRKTIHKKLQRQMYDHLCSKQEHGGSLTLRERQFLEEYSKIAKKQGKDAVIRRENKTKRRKKEKPPLIIGTIKKEGACMMKNLFEQSRSHWVRYDHYELKTAEDGKRYITPGKNAKPDVYNPLKEVPNIVLDALNVGMLMMGRKPEAEVEKAVMEFVTWYGLLGLMTALPTTPSFMDYEAVYLPKNHFIKEESMVTDQYLSLFYPFDQLDLVKNGIESSWKVSGDRMMVALTMTFMDEPMAKNMSFQREYAEPYDWVAQQFKDWAFALSTSILYYNDYDSIDEDARGLYRRAMAAFGGIAPSYHIELLDKPTIYWDFHSLLLGIQMMFSFMLVDVDQPLRLCKHCQKVFLGSRSNAAFCSPRCKNQYNVYKSREKSKEEAD